MSRYFKSFNLKPQNNNIVSRVIIKEMFLLESLYMKRRTNVLGKGLLTSFTTYVTEVPGGGTPM